MARDPIHKEYPLSEISEAGKERLILDLLAEIEELKAKVERAVFLQKSAEDQTDHLIRQKEEMMAVRAFIVGSMGEHLAYCNGPPGTK